MFDGDAVEGRVVLAPEKLSLENRARSVFLFPADQAPKDPLRMNDVKPRPWGWITVRPGGLAKRHDKRLLLTEIQAEDFDDEQVHPVRFLLWLKEQLQRRNEVTFGVVARDVPERVYRDIGYTSGAEALRRDGVAWAQFEKSRSVFQPADPDRTSTRS